MAKYSSQELDNVYHALSNSTRRKIITQLVNQPATITEIAAPFAMSLAAVSKHIKVLEEAGLLQKTREGTTFRCKATVGPVRSAAALIHYLEQFLPPVIVTSGEVNAEAKERELEPAV